jgi:hypothetical protein
MRLRTILIGAAMVVVSFLGASVAMQMLSRSEEHTSELQSLS